MNKSDFSELENIKANALTITQEIARVNAKLVQIKDLLVAHYTEVHPDDKAGVVTTAEGLISDLNTKVAELQALVDAANA